jgi:antitoxin ParD1/3/4
MPTRNVQLNEHLDEFIEGRINSGRFSDASELVGEALRLLEEREREEDAKLEWLRNAAKEGFDAFDRGDFTTLRSGDEIAEFVRGLAPGISSQRR